MLFTDPLPARFINHFSCENESLTQPGLDDVAVHLHWKCSFIYVQLNMHSKLAYNGMMIVFNFDNYLDDVMKYQIMWACGPK